jgi:ABC-type transport system involved in multi-copper enzyme maturation permease subunit
MRNLLRADLRRILKRVSIYVWLFLIFVIFFLSALSKDYTADIIGMEQGVTSLLGPILVSIPVFLGVYGREIQAGSMQCVIGRGMSRTKLILTKYLECVLMCLFFFFFIWLAFFLRNNVGDAGLTANQNKMMTIFVLFAFIKTCGYFAFTTFFFFIAWSVAPGIVALLVSAFLMPLLITMLDGFLKTDFSEFYFNGMIDNAYASIAAGDFGYTLILAIVLYIGGALLLTALVFRKKEIEF